MPEKLHFILGDKREKFTFTVDDLQWNDEDQLSENSVAHNNVFVDVNVAHT